MSIFISLSDKKTAKFCQIFINFVSSIVVLVMGHYPERHYAERHFPELDAIQNGYYFYGALKRIAEAVHYNLTN